VVRRFVCDLENLVNEEALAHWGVSGKKISECNWVPHESYSQRWFPPDGINSRRDKLDFFIT